MITETHKWKIEFTSGDNMEDNDVKKFKVNVIKTEWRYDLYEIDFVPTMEYVLELCKRYDSEVIINAKDKFIEIYDDYRE